MGANSSNSSKVPTRQKFSSYNHQHDRHPGYTPGNPPYHGQTYSPGSGETTYNYPGNPPYHGHTSSPGYGKFSPEQKKRFKKHYEMIPDNFGSLEEVTQALARAGLESSNLIVGIDFTKSNEWTGAKLFNGASLHYMGDAMNPYEEAISIIGKTLAAFDDDNLIPCYRFGDARTHDQGIFSFYPDEKPCNGFEEVLVRYREIVPNLRLSGPTSFAPLIEKAMTIVEESGGQYHVLLIIADGQVTRSVDTEPGRFSPQEQRTVDAIVAASKYPLSIVLVGVGDGPWDMMIECDDNIPARDFDNLQFVNFTEIMATKIHYTRKEAKFALSALMEIPSQYQATMELGLLGTCTGTCPGIVALPPPAINVHLSRNPSPVNYSIPSPSKSFRSNPFPGEASFAGYADPPGANYSIPSPSKSFRSNPFPGEASFAGYAGPPGANSVYNNQQCPICFFNNKNMAFGCGHQTCVGCGQDLQQCPICRSFIETRIKLF